MPTTITRHPSNNRQQWKSAIHAILTYTLGLSTRELAEIGGFTDRTARYLMGGKKPFPQDVCDALIDIQDDINVMTDTIISRILDGERAIFAFKTNADLRFEFPEWLGRGKASGSFVGPHRIAAMYAREILIEEYGIEVDILFFERQLIN